MSAIGYRSLEQQEYHSSLLEDAPYTTPAFFPCVLQSTPFSVPIAVIRDSAGRWVVVTEPWIAHGWRTEWMLGIAASVLLLPQSVCCFVYVISVFVRSSAFEVPGLPPIGPYIPYYLTAAPFIYSLVCVWWLFFRFPLSVRTIPGFVSAGIFMGTISAVFFAIPGTVYPLAEYTTARVALGTYMFGGPQLMALMILLLLHRRDKHTRRV